MSNFRQVTFKTRSGEQGKVAVLDTVDFCPICGIASLPIPVGAIANDGELKTLWRSYQCPNIGCESLFIGEFTFHFSMTGPEGQYFSLKRLYPKTFRGESFPSEIGRVSARFAKIYNQALQSEELNLDEICGPGFRKALEFLVKDFAVHESLGGKGH